MKFDAQNYRYPSRRELVYARKGMVCTSQPLAAQAGLDTLKAGGNAVDAAVATAAAMTVLEPTSNGLGSDAFALVWLEEKKELLGLNASGRAPKGITAELVKAQGYQEMPQRGWIPVMVPGAPSAWAELTKKYGKRTLRENLEPAIRYAKEGYAVTPTIAKLWNSGYGIFDGIRRAAEQFSGLAAGLSGEMHAETAEELCSEGSAKKAAWVEPWFAHFAPEGRAPQAGEVWRSEDMARSLELIGESWAEEYYRGGLAEKMDAFSRETGGYLRKEDLAAYWCEWVKPIHVKYRGYDAWEIPPNGDGIIALMALNILKNFTFEAGYDSRQSAENCHKQLEAMKMAFADGTRYVADRRYMKVTEEELLAPEYGAARAACIGDTARLPEYGDPKSGGTIYLCTADSDGNMVSFIQSNYSGFGSGVVIPGTGISLQNRGYNFSLDETSVNFLEPGKKSFHTIIPGFLTKDGEAVGPFGVMGAFMQPQGHVQVLMNMIDFGLNPQEALDAPRWQWIKGKKVQLEPSFPQETAGKLAEMGHETEAASDSSSFGRGEMILKLGNGVYCGAAEPRAAGTVAAW